MCHVKSCQIGGFYSDLVEATGILPTPFLNVELAKLEHISSADFQCTILPYRKMFRGNSSQH